MIRKACLLGVFLASLAACAESSTVDEALGEQQPVSDLASEQPTEFDPTSPAFETGLTIEAVQSAVAEELGRTDDSRYSSFSTWPPELRESVFECQSSVVLESVERARLDEILDQRKLAVDASRDILETSTEKIEDLVSCYAGAANFSSIYLGVGPTDDVRVCAIAQISQPLMVQFFVDLNGFMVDWRSILGQCGFVVPRSE